jgi:SNF2 family DNA or RNA helicase
MKRGRQSYTLYDHQVEGVESILKALQHGHVGGVATRAFLLHDEMGLGKTIQAIESARQLNMSLPVLVVCPASCERIWLSENPSDHFQPVAYSHKSFSKLHLTPQTMVIISYDLLRNLYKYYIEDKFAQGALTNDELIRFCKVHGKQIENRTQFLRGDDLRRELLDISRTIKQDSVKVRPYSPALMRQQWGMVILDEVHRIRSPGSTATKAVGFLNATYRLGLSGTPIVNTGNDLLTIWKYGLGLFDLNWASIKANPSSDYCKDIIDTVSLGRRKENIQGLALPKRNKAEEDVVFAWDRDVDQKRTYVQIKTDNIAFLKKFENLQRLPGESDQDYHRRRLSMQQTFLGKMQKLRQVCLHPRLPHIMKTGQYDSNNLHWTPASHASFPGFTRACVFALLCGLHRAGICLKEVRTMIVREYVNYNQAIVPSPKMIYVWDMLRAYPTQKVVVFCTFRVFLEQVMRKWLKQIGIQSMLFAGGSKSLQRKALEEFEERSDVRVLLIVKGAGSEGLNLQCANICVIMDPHFNLAMDEQAAQRIDRIGQKHDEVLIRRLYMEGSIDMAMKMLQEDKVGNMQGWSKNSSNYSVRSLKAQGLFLEKRDTVQ